MSKVGDLRTVDVYIRFKVCSLFTVEKQVGTLQH